MANSGIIGPKIYLYTVLLGRPNPKLKDVDLLLQFAEERSVVVKPREYEVGWLQFKGEEKMPDTRSLTVEQLKTKM